MSAAQTLTDNPLTKMGITIGRGIKTGAVTPDEGAAERLGRKTGSATLARAGQRVDVVGAVLTLIIVAVIAYVGLDVVAEVEGNTDVSGNSNLSNASNSLDSGVEGAFSLMGVVFLVLLLAVIIGLFIGLRR